MADCYSKNGILKGAVDFYCLVCETYLRSEVDNTDHIAKPIHKKNLDSTQYVKGFEEDFVRKIKMGYFCELCNKLLPMMARVKIHVKEQTHIDSKNVMYFKRIGVNVIALGKVVINEKAWNGLNYESCAFCNTEYEDEDIHKNLLSHILNMIQIKVEVDENKNIYRKIDDVSFHCLTCNMVLALNDITLHFEEDQHKQLYQRCCDISLNKINKNELKENESNKITETQSDKNNDGLAKSLNNSGENTEQIQIAKSTNVTTKSDVLENTTAIDAIPLNKIGKNEVQSKIAINSVGTKMEVLEKKSEDCIAIPSDKTAEIKEESKAVKDVDANIKNKNLGDKKVKKNKTKKKPSEIDNTKKPGTSQDEVKTSRNRFDIEEYEKKICKVLRTRDYITLDENGKTLCILCDWIMDPNAKKVHIMGQHHQMMLKMHKKRLAEITDKNNNESVCVPLSQNNSILDLVRKFQENNVNINLIFNTAVCKKCTVNLPYDVNAIEEHILQHNKETNKQENNVILLSSEAVNKKTCVNTNEVTLQDNSKEGNAVTDQKEEKLAPVEERRENDEPISKQAPVETDEKLFNETSLKVEVKSEIIEPSVSVHLQKKTLSSYIKILSGVKHTIFSDLIINEVLCISLLSFNYLLTNKGETKCLVCEEEVTDSLAHINKVKHITLLNEIPVIIKEESEFVREIRPELLHCGFCNMTVLSWNDMEEHFNSSSHKEIKNAAGWRMLMYNTQIQKECKISVSDLSVRNMFNELFELL